MCLCAFPVPLAHEIFKQFSKRMASKHRTNSNRTFRSVEKGELCITGIIFCGVITTEYDSGDAKHDYKHEASYH